MDSSTIQEKLFESFQKHKTRAAIEYGERELTYAQLAERAASVTRAIINGGVKHGSFIGIYVEDKIDFIASLIGVLNARCVFVPLEMGLPAAQIERMIRSTDTDCLLSDAVGCGRLAGLGSGIEKELELLRIDDLKASTSDAACDREHHPEDPIYVYFTSGSTGAPKAVLGKNKSVNHFIEWEIETFALDKNVRISQFTAAGFDALLRDLFTPLYVGGTVCIPPKELIPDSGRLIDWIEAARLELIHCVPSLFRLFAGEPLRKDSFPDLKYVLLAGERVHPHDLNHWYRTLGERVQLVNLYGPTETTMIKSYYFIREKDVQAGKIPIGKAMKGARLILFDKDMNICAPGTIGEIYIRTPYRTLGYYKNTPLNRERFIPNPVTGNADDLLYRTGDLGKELPDGNIEFLGRIDRQIKIMGIRVEEEEIESVVRSYPGVSQAAVIAVETKEREPRLNAFVVSGETLAIDKLREYLFERLPGYMIPSRFRQLDAVPLTPNGKTDRKALEELAKKTKREVEYEAPVTREEKFLADLWCGILQLEKVSINDDFFELGGQSLGILKTAAEIKREFDVDIPEVRLFLNPTIKTTAAYIQREQYEEMIDGGGEKQYLQLKAAGEESGNVFFLPPGIGVGGGYKNLTLHLSGCNIYSFDFIEDERRIQHYADKIMAIQKKGPYYLFGFSAGGNLAFVVGQELEQRGEEVGDIVVIDSFYREVPCILAQRDEAEQFFNDLGVTMEQFGLGHLKDKVIERSKCYYKYHERSVESGSVNARIHLVTSDDRDERKKRIKIDDPETEAAMRLKLDWQEAGKSRTVYKGFGRHAQMFGQEYIVKNGAIIQDILARIVRQNEEKKGNEKMQ